MREIKDPLPKEVFRFLVDPITKERLVYSKNKKWLIAPKSKSKYAIKKGIPVLLPPGYEKA